LAKLLENTGQNDAQRTVPSFEKKQRPGHHTNGRHEKVFAYSHEKWFKNILRASSGKNPLYPPKFACSYTYELDDSQCGFRRGHRTTAQNKFPLFINF